MRGESRPASDCRPLARYPQFIAPDVPAELASTLAAWSHDRGWRFLQAGDLRNADQEFGLALRSPDFYPSMAGRGYVELARDEPRAALGYFDQALAVRADYVSALVGRGETLLALHRDADAIATFERALTTQPGLNDVRRRVEVLKFQSLERDLAAARQAAKAGRSDEAVQLYRAAIGASPDSPFLYRELGLVEAGRGETDAALEHLRRAVELDPSDAASLGQMARIFEARDDVAEALRLYEEALAIEPSVDLTRRRDALRERIELAKLPDEYRAIPDAPQITRGDLAALIGVRLGPALGQSRDAVRRHRPAQPLGGNVDHGGGARGRHAGLRESHVPAARSRRSRPARGDCRAAARGSRAAGAYPRLAQRGHPLLGRADRPPGVSGGVGGRGLRRAREERRRELRAVAPRHGRGGRADRRTAARDDVARRRLARPSMTAMTPANQLTLLRVVLIPAFVILVIYGYLGWALVVFATAGLTDALDGLLARWSGQRTSLGAWLDPMADKLLLVTTFIVLTIPGLGLANRLPIWLTVLIISRDVVIVLTVAIVNLAIGPRTFRPSIYGKAATATYIVTAVIAMFFNYLGYHSLFVDVCIYASLAITLISGLHYIRHTAHTMEG